MTRVLIRLRLLTAACLILLCSYAALPAVAQETTPDYEAWATVAQRAELAVQNGRASSGALETLRLQVADWRQRFLNAQNVNTARISTLESQIAALGQQAEGTAEDPAITARRDELNDQLAKLKAPVKTAQEAYSRSDGIIREIDRLIRERQTNELLQGGPSPLNPVHWAPALEDVGKSISATSTEFTGALGSQAQRRVASRDLPEVILFSLLGLVLVWRGRRWGGSAADLLRQRTRRGGVVWTFVASLIQIALPFIGLTLIVAGIFETGLIGLRGTLLLDNVPLYGLVILSVWWLAEQLFPRREGDNILPLDDAAGAELRWYALALTLVLILAHILSVLAGYDKYDDATRAVLGFPLLVLTGLMLFRVGNLLRMRVVEPDDNDSAGGYRIRIARLLGRASRVIAIVGPLVAAAGYGTAAARLMFPSIATLAIFGFLLVLQHFAGALYRFVFRLKEDDDSLVPILIGFALVLVALPFLALVWGARVADLSELWTRFQEGFSIGESRISPMDFIMFAIVFTIGYMATRLLQGAMRTSVLPRTKMDAGASNAIVSGIGYIGIFLAALVAISSAGLDLSSLAIVAGALSVGIGFGLQNIVSNFVSGIILLIERPIAEGDWIEVGGKMGYVRGISVRSTRIETFDRTDVIVPNADLVSGMVTNWTRGKTVGRVIVPVGVAYGNDTRKVEDILMGVAREHPMVLLNPAPSIVFQGFGADSLDFEIRAILRDVNYVLSVKSDMNHEIAKRFSEEGIEIPFAQRDIWIRNPEAIAPAGVLDKSATEHSGDQSSDQSGDETGDGDDTSAKESKA